MEYILVDIGNVIFHDYPVDLAFSRLVYDQLQPYKEISMSEFLSIRKKMILSGNMFWHEEIGHQVCGTDWINVRDRHWSETLRRLKELTVPIDGAIETIQRISCVKPIVIAANQPIEAMETIKSFGLTRYCKDIVLDSMIGYTKPEPEFYKNIINRLNVRPDQLLMIGDRYENDIEPAAELGIKTAWVRFKPQRKIVEGIDPEWAEMFFSGYCEIGNYNYAEHTRPADELKADYEADSLQDLFKSLQ
ncbi:HAD family hydrolase [Paenibacillus silvae]|nr:HAD family hydrolase [Paenibacillus silvae]